MCVYQHSASVTSNCRPAKCVVNTGHWTSLLAEEGSSILLWHTTDNHSHRNIPEHFIHSNACGSEHILCDFLKKLLFSCPSTSKVKPPLPALITTQTGLALNTKPQTSHQIHSNRLQIKGRHEKFPQICSKTTVIFPVGHIISLALQRLTNLQFLSSLTEQFLQLHSLLFSVFCKFSVKILLIDCVNLFTQTSLKSKVKKEKSSLHGVFPPQNAKTCCYNGANSLNKSGNQKIPSITRERKQEKIPFISLY